MRDVLSGDKKRTRSPTGASTTKVALLAVVLVILTVGGVTLYVAGRKHVVKCNPNTLCPQDDPPSEVIVLLLDMSDAFSEQQRLKIQTELDRLVEHVPRFALIEVYAVDPVQQRVARPVVHLCNPGTGADLNAI